MGAASLLGKTLALILAGAVLWQAADRVAAELIAASVEAAAEIDGGVRRAALFSDQRFLGAQIEWAFEFVRREPALRLAPLQRAKVLRVYGINADG